MVAAENEEVLRVLHLVCQQQGDGLETLLTSVNIVTQKQIVRRGRKTTVLEKPQQVIVLPMNISADFDGSF